MEVEIQGQRACLGEVFLLGLSHTSESRRARSSQVRCACPKFQHSRRLRQKACKLKPNLGNLVIPCLRIKKNWYVALCKDLGSICTIAKGKKKKKGKNHM